METIRVTMDSARLAPIIDLPVTLRDREVEVVVRSKLASYTEQLYDDDDDEPKIDSFMGILKEYANPALRELEKGAWERAAVEKYLEKMKDACS